MHMVRHIVSGDHFLFFSRDDASDEFLQFIVVFRLDEILPALDGKDDVDEFLESASICGSLPEGQ